MKKRTLYIFYKHKNLLDAKKLNLSLNKIKKFFKLNNKNIKYVKINDLNVFPIFTLIEEKEKENQIIFYFENGYPLEFKKTNFY